MDRVLVLMSTYNGSKFILEQLDSIFNQIDVDITIYVRDDGSIDNTVKLIENYNHPKRKIQIITGENIGCAKSFFLLLTKAELYSTKYEYFALSDQDDIWEPQKIKKGIRCLQTLRKSSPNLYCSNLKILRNNKLDGLMYSTPISPSIHNSLLSNIVTGCTTIFNIELIKLINELGIPDFPIMHDWWMYKCAITFGNVYYDESSYIMYRQHGHNVIGARTQITLLEKSINLWKSIFDRQSQHYREQSAIEFLEKANKRLTQEQSMIIKEVSTYRASFKNRIILVLDKKITNNNFRIIIRIIFGLI